MSRRCINDKDSFCYTCSELVFKENRKTIDEFYMKAYYTYFKIKLGGQDKTWRLTLSASHAKKSYDSGRQATKQLLNSEFL